MYYSTVDKIQIVDPDITYEVDKIPPPNFDEDNIFFNVIEDNLRLVRVIVKALLKRNWRKRVDDGTALYIVNQLLTMTKEDPNIDCFAPEFKEEEMEVVAVSRYIE